MPANSGTDPFRPPEVPTEVGCLHCGQSYDSYLIEWRTERRTDGTEHGVWCCPTPGCSGQGFGFDILPTDPTYQDEHGGWVWDDDEDDEEFAIAEDDSEMFEFVDGPDDTWDENDVPF